MRLKRFIFSSIAFLSCYTFVNAQFDKPISKNHLFTGGTIKISTEKYIQYKYGGIQEATQDDKGINLDFYTGYFVINQFAVGIKMNYNYDRRVWITNTPIYNSSILFDPFARYYLKMGIFGEVSVGMGLTRDKYGSDLKQKESVFNWNTGIGYNVFITKNISLETIIGYSQLIKKEKMMSLHTYEYKKLNLKIGLQVYFDLNKKNTK